MNQDTHKTTVRFYVEKGGSILAYFPEIDWSNGDKCCYSGLGQHSSCHPDYLKQCVKATPQQYQPLKTELESIGYNLLIS